MGLKSQRYIDDSGFENFEVIDKKTLNFFDVAKNSNKFYTLEIHKKGNNFRLFTDYGRLGVTSMKEVRITSDLSEAEKEFQKILKSKLKKGYVEVQLAQSTTGSDKAKELIDTSEIIVKKTSKTAKKSSLELSVQKFVSQIFEEAGQKLNQFVKGSAASDGTSPLGKLSIKQIEKGRDILQELADIISIKQNLTISDVIGLSNEFYRYIPKAFGRRVTEREVAILNSEQLSNEMDMLKFYEDSLRMGDVLFDSNIDKQYNQLKCDIGILNKTSDKYHNIVNYVHNSESRHHGVHLDVKQIFTVKQKNAPKFDSSCGNIQELFHGTRSSNMPGILSSHLKLPNTLKGVYITGAMYGPGVYFADQSTKSSQYACSRFGGTANKHKTAFMFLAEVALGKIKEEYHSHYYNEPPRGYDSVKGVAGPSLLHNEYIVYKENQHELKYIIEFEPKSGRR